MNRLTYILGLCLLIVLSSWSCGSPAPEATLTRVRAQLPKEPRRLFPLLAATSYETQVNDLIYQYLLHFDPKDGIIVPQLAKEMPSVTELPDGNTQYNFTLRDNIRWSDGEPLTVDDVLFTFKAIWFPGLASSPLRGGIRELIDVKPDSDNPLAFTIIASTENLNGAANYGNIPILPEHIYDTEKQLRGVNLPALIAAESTESLPEDLRAFASEERVAPFGKTLVVGSGQYILDQWEPERYVRLVKDNDFWGADLDGGLFLANPDTIEFIPVPDAKAAEAMLVNGELDILANVTPRDAVRLGEDPMFNLYSPRQLTRTFIYLNMKDPLLADADTRKGLAHLLDVEGFLRDVQMGFGESLNGPYLPVQPYAKASEHPMVFSIELAKAAFAKAGWADSDGDGVLDRNVNGQAQQLALEYLYPSVSASSEALALLYANAAKEAGVAVTPVGKEFGALIGDLTKRNFQLVQGALGGEALPDDPYGLWHTKSDSPGGKNRSGFGNAATDALIDSIRINLDEVSRNAQYQRLAVELADQQPVIFLIVPKARLLVNSTFNPMLTDRRPGYWLPGFSLADQAN
ncbi:MAG: ABC transporter substrate-binding protein [Saprospiraceae bacterium]